MAKSHFKTIYRIFFFLLHLQFFLSYCWQHLENFKLFYRHMKTKCFWEKWTEIGKANLKSNGKKIAKKLLLAFPSTLTLSPGQKFIVFLSVVFFFKFFYNFSDTDFEICLFVWLQVIRKNFDSRYCQLYKRHIFSPSLVL